MAFKNKQKVSVIIPAFNEGGTIGQVARIAGRHPWVSEVLVVDDGSTDNTAEASRRAGARVLALERNLGKAMAMDMGVSQAGNEVLCFLDADIKGLDLDILSRIISPVLFGDKKMFVAIRGRRSWLLNRLLWVFPLIGGERCLTKGLWRLVPDKYKKNFQIEIALNYFAKQNGCRMGSRLFPGLSQVVKEKKRGFWLGLFQRMGMIKDIVIVAFKLYIIGACQKPLIKMRQKDKKESGNPLSFNF